MKPLSKKILSIGLPVVAVSAIVGTSLGIYFSTPSIEHVSKKGMYIIRQNAKLNEFGYKYDMSATYGSSQSNSLSVIIANSLVSLKTEGQLILDEKNKTIRPSYQSYKFELADSIVLFLENNVGDKFELVFDNDHSEFPSFSDSDVAVNKISNHKNSINNKDIFLKLIANGTINRKVNNVDEINTNDIVLDGEYAIKNMGFTIKKNVKWVDSSGNKTKYNICAEDFYYSFMRTKLFDTNYRRSNGGSKDLDSYFINKANATSRFLEKDRYPNGYLYDFFDIDINALENSNTAIKKTQNGEEAFVFTIKNDVENTTGFLGVLDKFVVNNIELSAAPSQYIKELAKDNIINNPTNNLKIEGKSKEFGIYTYGQDRTTNLFASKYVPISSKEQRETFKYNKYYADQDWVKNVNEFFNGVPIVENGKVLNDKFEQVKALNTIIFEYTNGVDTSTFNSQLLTSYLSGTISEIQYSDLTPTQKQMIYGNDPKKIRDNAIKNGLQYSKKLNISSLVQRTIVQSNPAKDGLGKYAFNNNYSKLVYGNSLEQLNKGTAITTENFYSGLGMEFRTLVQASINWDTYISQSYTGQRILWLNSAAPDAKFSSFRVDSANPIKFYEDVNTLMYFDRDKNDFVSITPAEMKKHSNDNTIQIEQIKSPKYNDIKKNMKQVLDEFYQNEKLDNNKDKITWKVVYPYWNQDSLKTSVMDYIVKIINELDSRIKAELVIPKTREEALDLINKNYGVNDFNGWGYDYEGIGSYFAAFVNGAGVNIINALGLFNQDASSNPRLKLMQDKMPEFTKFSKFTAREFDELLRQETTEQDKLNKLESAAWATFDNEVNQDLKTYYNKILGSNKFDPTSILSKIFKKYEGEQVSDQEWATLIKEFNVIKGVTTDTDNSILNPYTASLALHLKEYSIPTSKYGILYFGDYRVKEE